MKSLMLFCRLLAAGLLLSLFSPLTKAATLPVVKPVIDCSALAQQNFSAQTGAAVTILSARNENSEKGTYCKVSARIAPDIGVQVALPTEHWTQRFLQVGCGGLCGTINLSLSNTGGCVPAMNGEFVVAATDMGHSGSMMDASWAEDPQKRIDFAWRANHLTAQLSKALISALYHQPQKYAYFMGCSDGGREALMEAQRFPEDFNGISAGAPAAFFSFQNSFFHGWSVVANERKDGSAILLADRLPFIHQTALAHCPTLSGVNDGILQNPYACHFSPSWFKICKPGDNDHSACLTREELGVVSRYYEGANDGHGHQFVPGGFPIGSELRWPVPATRDGTSPAESMVLPALQSVLLTPGKNTIRSMRDFPLNQADFDKVARYAPLYNAANTNLAPFRAQGGKLIMWHGLADDSVSPAFSLAYYQGVVKTLGQKDTDTFLKLFLLPGVAHCGRGEGYDQVDLLTPLMAWTEDGKAPQELITGKTLNAEAEMPAGPAPSSASAAQTEFHGVQRPSVPYASAMPALKATRPVYPYPDIAVYKGEGDKNQASSWKPVKSEAFAAFHVNAPAADFIGPDNQKDYKAVGHQLQVISH